VTPAALLAPSHDVASMPHSVVQAGFWQTLVSVPDMMSAYLQSMTV
jgi:hypothetical protein